MSEDHGFQVLIMKADVFCYHVKVIREKHMKPVVSGSIGKFWLSYFSLVATSSLRDNAASSLFSFSGLASCV